MSQTPAHTHQPPTKQDLARLDNARTRLAAARMRVSEVQPYLSSLIWRLVFHPRLVWKDPVGDSMATDERGNVFVNVAWVEKASVDFIAAVLVHESYHLLRSHFSRTGDRDKLLANISGDAAINPDVDDCWPEHARDRNCIRPDSPLFPDKTPCGLSMEDYYELLEKQVKSGAIQMVRVSCGSCAGNKSDAEEPVDGPGGLKAQSDAAGKDGEDPADITPAEWETVKIAVAAEVNDIASGRKAGHVPQGLQRWAHDTMQPSPVDWRRVLSGVIKGVLRRSGMWDFTYTRPSRRKVPGVIMPALRAPNIRAAVVVDTSGSRSEPELQGDLDDIKALLKAAGADDILLVVVDAEVHARRRVRTAGQAGKLFSGGGGTDMRVGIESACKAEHGERPSIVIVLTDGETPWPDKAPPVRTAIVCPPQGPETPKWAIRVERTKAVKNARA